MQLARIGNCPCGDRELMGACQFFSGCRQIGVLHGVARPGRFRAQARSHANGRRWLLREQVHVIEKVRQITADILGGLRVAHDLE